MYHLHTWLVPITDSARSPRQRANLVLGTDRQKKSVNRMAEFQEVVTNSKQRDPLVAEMNDYLTYFLVQKKEQHKIQTNVRASRTFLRPMTISLPTLLWSWLRSGHAHGVARERTAAASAVPVHPGGFKTQHIQP
jgi:hypothetical protein